MNDRLHWTLDTQSNLCHYDKLGLDRYGLILSHEYCEDCYIGSELLQLNISMTKSAKHTSNPFLLRVCRC